MTLRSPRPMPDAAPFRALSACLLRPRRHEALLTLCGMPLPPDRLAQALDVTALEILPLLADLTRAGLVYENSGSFHPTGFGFEATAFVAVCPEAEPVERRKAVGVEAGVN